MITKYFKGLFETLIVNIKFRFITTDDPNELGYR